MYLETSGGMFPMKEKKSTAPERTSLSTSQMEIRERLLSPENCLADPQPFRRSRPQDLALTQYSLQYYAAPTRLLLITLPDDLFAFC
jgi:hypothetical protein